MKQLVIALSAALVVCFVVIAFLAGRMSAPAAPIAPVAPVAPVIVQQPAAPVIETKPVEQTRPPVIVKIPPVAAPKVSHRADIEAYFTKIKTEQVMEGSDPNAYAQEMMQGAMKGDTSSFDQILAAADKAERSARAIKPPEECAEYHRTMLELLGESRGLIKDMRDAIASKNMESLAGIAQKAQSMQARTEELEAMEKEIRAQSQPSGG